MPSPADTIRSMVPFHTGTSQMQKAPTLLQRLITDESGGETLEFSLVAGLIIMAALGMVKQVGIKVLARWQSLNNSL